MNFLLFFCIIIFSFKSFAELRIDITRGNTEPIPLALLKFNNNNADEQKISRDINKVISNNLQRSGLLRYYLHKYFLINPSDLMKHQLFQIGNLQLHKA